MSNDKTTSSKVLRSKSYIRYLFFTLALVQIMDAYTTSYTAAFPSKIAEEFMVSDTILQLMVAIATIGMYFVIFNQYFSDKFGRKIMLTVTTLGMGVSALFLALSTNAIIYTIFLFSTYLFFSSDMWLIYANEESPSKKKAIYTNILLACGILGPIMMPIMRGIFIT